MSKHVLARVFRHLQNSLSLKDRAVLDYLEGYHAPPKCPWCFRSLHTLLEKTIYSFTWNASTGKFTIDPTCLKAFCCPRCNNLFNSPALHALIDFDSFVPSKHEELVTLSTAPPPKRHADPYADLAWNLSKDDPSFSWILVDERLDQRARQLIEEIGRTPSHRAHYGKVVYSLSTTKANGTRFLHRNTETAEPKKP